MLHSSHHHCSCKKQTCAACKKTIFAYHQNLCLMEKCYQFWEPYLFRTQHHRNRNGFYQKVIVDSIHQKIYIMQKWYLFIKIPFFSICSRVFSNTTIFVSLIYKSIITSVLYYIDYFSFAVSFEIRKWLSFFF